MRGVLLACLVALLAGACEEQPSLPQDHPGRQRTLSERIIGALQKASTLNPGQRADLALAVAEVVVPSQSPRLRLAVAGDDPIVGRGAAVALARILNRREGAKGLVSCWKEDTNPFVRAACLEELGRTDPALRAKLAEEVASGASPALVARKAELLAAMPPVPEARPVVPLLESEEPEKRREGLRILLQAPKAGEGETRLENALVHVLTDRDPQVVLLASAVYLRRSLAVSPPPPDAAMPDTRTP